MYAPFKHASHELALMKITGSVGVRYLLDPAALAEATSEDAVALAKQLAGNAPTPVGYGEATPRLGTSAEVVYIPPSAGLLSSAERGTLMRYVIQVYL